MVYLLIILLVLAIYDVVSTLYVLEHGGREVNPVLVKLFSMFPGKEAEVLFTK